MMMRVHIFNSFLLLIFHSKKFTYIKKKLLNINKNSEAKNCEEENFTKTLISKLAYSITIIYVCDLKAERKI